MSTRPFLFRPFLQGRSFIARWQVVCYYNCLRKKHLRYISCDVDIETFEPQVLSSIHNCPLLEYGDFEAIAWLRQQFSEDSVARRFERQANRNRARSRTRARRYTA